MNEIQFYLAVQWSGVPCMCGGNIKLCAHMLWIGTRYSYSRMRSSTTSPETPRRKCPGGSKTPTVLRLRLLNASVISTLLYRCEYCKLTKHIRCKLNLEVSKNYGTDECRWGSRSDAGVIDCGPHPPPGRTSGNCMKRIFDSLFGDVPHLDREKAAEIAYGREKWKRLRASQRW